jgi:hypothetical protein
LRAAWDLLARLHALGASVQAEDGRLAVRVTVGGLPDELRALVGAHKNDLLALLRPPAPPPGSRLFFEGEKGKLCWPEEAERWTWEGALRWYYTREHPVPPCEMALAPHVRKRCPNCSRIAFRVVFRDIKGGKRQLQCRCVACDALVCCLPQEPGNPDLGWKAA